MSESKNSASSKPVPLNDLGRGNSAIQGDLQAAADRVLSSGWYVLGPELRAFEAHFATYCGTEDCVGVANGTDALELALRAVGVRPGEQVITTANAGMYSTTAIRAVGARPVYVDIDRETMNMDPAALERALTPEIKAVIVTHLYGRMAAMAELMALAERSGVPVVEDCAQAHGAQLDGKKAGSLGAVGCFSFYPTKNLGALGDGGAVVTSEAEIAERLRMLRQYGWSKKYCSELAGGRNSRLDELQAAILAAKLPHLDSWNEERRNIAERYTSGLQNLGLGLPELSGEDYVAHLYVIRTASRDTLSQRLSDAGIATDIHYPVPDHQQESALEYEAERWDLPVTEECSQQVLTLPCFYGMTGDEISRTIAAVMEAVS